MEHTEVVSERVVAYSFDQFAACQCPTGSCSPRVRTRGGPVPCLQLMSDHTERLEDLSKRIASAKEFL